MFLTIPCPGCNVSLKKPANLPAGKRIQCPHCGTAFAPTTEADAAQGVTTAFHPAADTSPAAPPPSRRTASAGSRGSAPPKRISTGAVLAVVALVVVLLLGGGALAVLAYFGSEWYAPSKSTDPVAVQQPPMPDMGKQMMQPPIGAGPGGPGGPGIFGPGPVGQPPGRPAPGRPAPGGPAPGRPAPGRPVQPPQVSPRIGEAAPEIVGKDLDGKAMKLSDFRGKVVVVDFWGDWCPFCKAAYTYQRQLARRMEGRSFVLLGVNCDQTAAQARLVVKNQRIGWRSWWDGPNNMSGPIYKRWGVQVVPSVFVLDTKGVVRQHFQGAPPEAALDAVVESLLPAAERGRPRWLASEQQLNQLGAESNAGAYRLRLPRDFAAQKSEPQEGKQMWMWKHSTVFKGATQLEVTLRPAADEMPDDAIEKVLAGLPCLRQGWNGTMVQRGEVNGLIFQRVKWSGFERGGKRPISGFVYAALDGDTLIRIAGQTTEPNGALLLLDAAALTFRKAPK